MQKTARAELFSCFFRPCQLIVYSILESPEALWPTSVKSDGALVTWRVTCVDNRLDGWILETNFAQSQALPSRMNVTSMAPCMSSRIQSL